MNLGITTTLYIKFSVVMVTIEITYEYEWYSLWIECFSIDKSNFHKFYAVLFFVLLQIDVLSVLDD